jgi:hypothetical protein
LALTESMLVRHGNHDEKNMRQTVAFAITLSAGLAVGLLPTTVPPLSAEEPPLVTAGPLGFASAVCVGGPGFPECSDASLGRARQTLPTVCPLGGFVELWCGDDGAIEQLRFTCNHRKPDAIV